MLLPSEASEPSHRVSIDVVRGLAQSRKASFYPSRDFTGAWLESAIAIQRFSVQVRYNCKERKNGELLPKRHQMKHLKF